MKNTLLLWVMILVTTLCAHGGQNDFRGTEASPASNVDEQTQQAEKDFNPGDFIFDHIGDSHEWHIFTIGHRHISIPLPIILYSRTQQKLFFFFSNKLHHGHSSYKGFSLMIEGEYKGKIVEVDESGKTIEGAQLPMDFSITKNVVGIWFSIALLLLIFIPVAKKYENYPLTAPKGLQSLMETVILFVRDDIARPSIGDRHYNRFMPFLLTVFFFILINNLLGLIPIFPAGANTTGNIAVTMALALCTLILILTSGNKHFWKDIFNPPGIPIFLKLPIPIMPFVEMASWIIKPLVLMIRLFANILAGHIIAMVLFGLIFIFGAGNIYFGYGISVVSILLTVFMSLLEILVAFIQAFVFTMLSAIFLGMATAEHH
ncbi:MAG TPA: F0F1 ATP synthase subunit A [Tenuifilaceae bacterium]|nr:F0F1 ATP synthase subunit A [Tenuifilaceae bacterium]